MTAPKRKSVSGIPLLIPGVTPNAGKDSPWRKSAGWSYAMDRVLGVVKICGVSISNIAKINGIPIASIVKINGVAK